MKLTSILAALALLIALPAFAAEPVSDALDLSADAEILWTPAVPDAVSTDVDLPALIGDTYIEVCMPGEPNFCESTAECPLGCVCRPWGCCEQGVD